jgi:ABC-type nitrate/sulfonate/bicarbonate transport system substrate-binding protein
MHRRIALVAAAALIVAACSQGGAASPGASGEPGEGGDDKTIFLGTGTTEAEAYMVPLLTIGREILGEQGITMEYIALSSDQAVLAALDRGRVDVALLSSLGLNRAGEAGLSAKFITGLQQHNPFVLVVPGDISDLAELKGKKVGIEDPTSLAVSVAEELMREQGGLEPATDYEMVSLSGSSNRAAAMESGALDAAVLFRAVGQRLEDESNGRFQVWGGLWDVLDPMLWEGMAASTAFRENTELATAFAEAVIETSKQFYAGDPAEMAARKDDHPETATLDVEGLTGDYELYQEIKLFPEDGGVSEPAWTGITEFLVRVGQLEQGQVVPFADAVDRTFVEAALGG